MSRNAISVTADLTDCPICLGPLQHPKCLPCIHTFCLKCILEYSDTQSLAPEGRLNCPVCRQPFKVPPEGVTKLPTNFFLVKLLEKRDAQQTSDPDAVLCVVCFDLGDNCKRIPAAMFCPPCNQDFCNGCSRRHGKISATERHQMIPIAEKMTWLKHQSQNSAASRKTKKSGTGTTVTSLTKRDISCPTNFRHVGHVFLDPEQGIVLERVDPALRWLLERAKVKANQLRDPDTAQFILDFIERNGGMAAVHREWEEFKSRSVERAGGATDGGGTQGVGGV